MPVSTRNHRQDGGSYLVSSVKKVTRPTGLLRGSTAPTTLNYITGDFHNGKSETGKGKMKFCKKPAKTPVEKKSHKNQHEK